MREQPALCVGDARFCPGMTSLELVIAPRVIASAAKQSIERQSQYGLLRCARNDGEEPYARLFARIRSANRLNR